MITCNEGNLKLESFRSTNRHRFEEKVLVRLSYQGDYSFSKVNNLKLKALNYVLRRLLVVQHRAQMQTSGMPSITCVLEKSTVATYSVVIGFSCSVIQTGRLIQSVSRVVEKLKAGDISDHDLEFFYEEELRHIALLLKQRLAMRFLSSLHQDETLEDFFGLYLNAKNRLQKNDLAATARLYLSKPVLKQHLV